MPHDKERIARLFTRGRTVAQVAEQAGVSKRTAYRVLRSLDDETQRRVRKATVKAHRDRCERRSKVAAARKAMTLEGKSPAEAAAELGVSTRWMRRVRTERTVLGSPRTVYKRLLRYRQRTIQRSQEARDHRKRTLDPFLVGAIWMLGELLPSEVWSTLMREQAVEAEVDLGDGPTTVALYLSDELSELAEYLLETWEDSRSESVSRDRAETPDAVYRAVSRTLHTRIYLHGDRPRLAIAGDDVQWTSEAEAAEDAEDDEAA